MEYITDILNELENEETSLKQLLEQEYIEIFIEKGSMDEHRIVIDTDDSIYQMLIHKKKQNIEALKEQLKDALGIEDFDPRMLEDK